MKNFIRDFFTDTIGKIVDFFCLNICFIITCIPVFTIGTSCSAMFYVFFHILEEKDAHLTRQYFKAWKNNFVPSNLIWMICSLIFFLCYRVFFMVSGNSISIVFYAIIFIILYLTCIFLIYFFSLQARFENTLGNMVKNAFVLSLQYLINSAECFIIICAPLILIFGFPKVASIVICIMILVGFSFQFYFQSKILFSIYEGLE